nr:NADH dehydrogenase subunit 5 [Micraspides sp.]
MLWLIIIYSSSFFFLMVASVIMLYMATLFMMSNMVVCVEWEIFSVNSVMVEMVLILDWMSWLFMSFVLFISSMVLYYSGGYMANELDLSRFIYLVLGFVGSMLLMIVSPNLISILLGWDGLGLVSYVLVIYYQNEKSNGAGMLTVLSNRIGDTAILLSIGLMFNIGSWSFLDWTEELKVSENFNFICWLVLLAGMTKSAQIPFSAWLPAAMAAPTPVSALVHSSTLVTAGVYLLIRFSEVLINSSAMILLFFLSSLTMFMAGLGANFEFDLKKIIALSTLSQLGVMMGILSVGYYDLAFFHLLIHALFKALLFMCAGSIIHNVGESQDIRSMGSLVGQMPIMSTMFNLSNLALCGMPFMAGFYSKDLILEMVWVDNLNYIGFMLYLLSTGLTVCYTMRLVYYSLSSTINLSSSQGISDESEFMVSPMVCLSFSAVIMGVIISWMVLPSPYVICLSDYFKFLTLIMCFMGGILGYTVNMMKYSYKEKSFWFYKYILFSGSMWFLPLLSSWLLTKSLFKLSWQYQKLNDGGWLEFYGSQGLYNLVTKKFNYLQMVQDNSLKIYVSMFMMWVLFFVFVS